VDDKSAKHLQQAAQMLLDFLWSARFDIPASITTTVRNVVFLAEANG